MTTSPTSPTWEVFVRRDDLGSVVIRGLARPESTTENMIRRAVIPVAGGSLEVHLDLAAVDDDPKALGAELYDPQAAQVWIVDVFGEAVAEAVAAISGAGHGPQEQAVTATVEYLTLPAIRLGVGLWLHRWWPAPTADIPPLDAALLEIELGGLAWLLESCFPEPDPIIDLLAPHLGYVADLVDAALAHGTGGANEQTLAMLTRSLNAIVEVVPASTEGYDRCQRHVDQLADRAGSDSVVQGGLVEIEDWLRTASLEVTGGWAEDVAIVTRSAGAGQGDEANGPRPSRASFTVDIAAVAPRLVSFHERNGSVELLPKPNGSAVLTVRVEASLDVTADDELAASVQAGQVHRELTLRPEQRSFAGAVTVRVDVDASGVVVDVHSPGVTWPARGRTQAREDREFVRETLRRRRGVTTGSGVFVAELVAEQVSRQR